MSHGHDALSHKNVCAVRFGVTVCTGGMESGGHMVGPRAWRVRAHGGAQGMEAEGA